MKKNIIKAVFLLAITSLFVALYSCNKGYNPVPFGSNLIYMPQATVKGGLNNNYTVPSGVDTSTFNFKSDTIGHKLYVHLGVTASGKPAAAGYTVNITAYNDTTNQIITANPTLNYMLMPSSMYTLPTSVTVPAGKNAATFDLTIDAAALNTYVNTTLTVGKKLLLTVGLSSPTKYMLNNQYAKTVVIIDVNALSKVSIFK
jgi:hypothetical protein